jgi:hypothetical protein
MRTPERMSRGVPKRAGRRGEAGVELTRSRERGRSRERLVRAGLRGFKLRPLGRLDLRRPRVFGAREVERRSRVGSLGTATSKLGGGSGYEATAKRPARVPEPEVSEALGEACEALLEVAQCRAAWCGVEWRVVVWWNWCPAWVCVERRGEERG